MFEHMDIKALNNASWLKDIRFWIAFTFILRLYGITNPPLEISHNWRQTTVTMAARNFHETDGRILYPRVDIAGEKTGITGMEFPLLNYSIAIVSNIFGYQHWYGRLINLLITCIGMYFFYLLIKLLSNESLAFCATMILCFSIWYTFGRKIMPDTFSMSFGIMSLFFGINYLKKGQSQALILSFICLLLGTLSKLPTVYLLVFYLIPFFSAQIDNRRKIIIAIFNLSALIINYWYYYQWIPYLTETYGFKHFFMGKSLGTGALELMSHPNETLGRFYDTAIKYIGFSFFMLGLFYVHQKKNSLLKYVFLLGFIGFIPIMLKSGFTFYHHSYYIIPFVPVMALISAYGVTQFKEGKYKVLILFAICLEGFLNHLDDFVIKPENQALVQLESLMDKCSDRNDLVLINSGAFPTPMYFAHRKGWVAFENQVDHKNYRDSLKKLGLKHIIVMNKTFGSDVPENTVDSSWTLKHKDENFKIWSLKPDVY